MKIMYVDPRDRAHHGLSPLTRELPDPAPIKGKARFVTDCVHSTREKIDRLTHLGQQITYKTFFKHVSKEQACAILPGGYGRAFPLSKDYHVAYYRSRWEGKRAFYLVHSAIEYVWVED